LGFSEISAFELLMSWTGMVLSVWPGVVDKLSLKKPVCWDDILNIIRLFLRRISSTSRADLNGGFWWVAGFV
jgi:hypothetical protein